jgi:hypothetical protein
MWNTAFWYRSLNYSKKTAPGGIDYDDLDSRVVEEDGEDTRNAMIRQAKQVRIASAPVQTEMVEKLRGVMSSALQPLLAAVKPT